MAVSHASARLQELDASSQIAPPTRIDLRRRAETLAMHLAETMDSKIELVDPDGWPTEPAVMSHFQYLMEETIIGILQAVPLESERQVFRDKVRNLQFTVGRPAGLFLEEGTLRATLDPQEKPTFWDASRVCEQLLPLI